MTTTDVLADLVLAAHAGFVVFVVLGLPVIFVGGCWGWSWVRNPGFRVAHLGGIAIVVAQAWAGVACPLTTLEMWLRQSSGAAVYDQSFVAYWLQRLLYYDLPAWVFTAVYTGFGLLVVLAAIVVPPRHRRRQAPARRGLPE